MVVVELHTNGRLALEETSVRYRRSPAYLPIDVHINGEVVFSPAYIMLRKHAAKRPGKREDRQLSAYLLSQAQAHLKPRRAAHLANLFSRGGEVDCCDMTSVKIIRIRVFQHGFGGVKLGELDPNSEVRLPSAVQLALAAHGFATHVQHLGGEGPGLVLGSGKHCGRHVRRGALQRDGVLDLTDFLRGEAEHLLGSIDADDEQQEECASHRNGACRAGLHPAEF